MTTKGLQVTFIIMSFLLGHQAICQNIQIDSLLHLLEGNLPQTEKEMVSLQLSKAYERLDILKSQAYANTARNSTNDSIRSEAHNQLGRAFFYQNNLDSAAYHFGKSIDLLEKLQYENKVASVGISLGAVQLRSGDYKKAVTTLIEGAEYFESVADSTNMAKCYSNVSTAFGELGNSDKAVEYGEKALIIFDKKNMESFKAITLPNLAGELVKLGDTITAKDYFLEAENLAKKRGDKFSLARIYNNLGNMYLKTDPDQSEKYLKLALALRKETKNNDGIAALYNNLGFLNLQKENPQKALDYLENAIEFVQGTNTIVTYNNLVEVHQKLGNYRTALEYAQKKEVLNDSILKVENQKAIAEISTKYETEKKEKEILNLQNENLQTDMKRRQNRNLMYSAFVLLVVSIVLAYAFLKNSKKRRIIAEQQQQLESQKVEKLLKEQELIGIDAMVEGQEKERERIAQDLHDSLGGKLSALKLFVENIKKTDPSLYTKIKTILDDSYEDVRSIAHQKNASAIIEEGLIPAVNMVAERLKSSEKLNVEVTNIDLKQRIRNFTALQLFRIIQELLTNTIKHAKAKNVSIQFSEEDNVLNVIYEDDGIGFDTKTTIRGVGLKNIDSRMRKIGGSFNVDSNPGDGVTVILNAPI